MEASRLVVLDEVDSTQGEAHRRFLEGERGPLWILARRQHAGRGRKGRAWHSPAGNLHLSLLTVLNVSPRILPQLSLVAAVAAHKALCAAALRAGRPQLQTLLRLKWPNDLLLAERKLGGILLESEPLSAKPHPHPEAAPPEKPATAVIIGWGVNLRHAPPDEAVRWPAASLADAGLSLRPETLAAGLRDSFGRWWRRWRTGGLGPVAEAWTKRAWGIGRRIAVHAGDALHRGRLLGLAPDGGLLLTGEDGRTIAFHAGEILPPDLSRETTERNTGA